MKKVLGALSLFLLVLTLITSQNTVGVYSYQNPSITVRRNVNPLIMNVLGGRYPGGVDIEYNGVTLSIVHSTGGIAIGLSRSQIAALAEGKSENGESLGVKRFTERDFSIFVLRDIILYADDGRLKGRGGEVYMEEFSGNGFFDAFPRYENKTFSLSERILERYHLKGPWQMDVVRGGSHIEVNLTSSLLSVSLVLVSAPGGMGETVYPRFIVTLGVEGAKRVKSVSYSGMVIKEVHLNRINLTVHTSMSERIKSKGGNLTLLTEFYALRYMKREVAVGFYRYTPQRSPPRILSDPPIERYEVSRSLITARNIGFKDTYTSISNITFEGWLRVYPLRVIKTRLERGVLYGIGFWAGMSSPWDLSISMDSPTEVSDVETRTPIVEHGSVQAQTMLIIAMSALIAGLGTLLLLKRKRKREAKEHYPTAPLSPYAPGGRGNIRRYHPPPPPSHGAGRRPPKI